MSHVTERPKRKKEETGMKGKDLGILILCAMILSIGAAHAAEDQGKAKRPDFSEGTATSSEECGSCHVAIYREYAMGFGGDTKYRGIVYQSTKDTTLTLPANVSSTATAHALAGLDPFPVHARGVE
jgi:hypothetical protein